MGPAAIIFFLLLLLVAGVIVWFVLTPGDSAGVTGTYYSTATKPTAESNAYVVKRAEDASADYPYAVTWTGSGNARYFKIENGGASFRASDVAAGWGTVKYEDGVFTFASGEKWVRKDKFKAVVGRMASDNTP